ncbi:hypothetical protein ACFX2F_002079 [Malus domestica]
MGNSSKHKAWEIFQRRRRLLTASPLSLFSSLPLLSVTGPLKPIRLVYLNKNGKFQMDQGVVSIGIVGHAYQGNSFILNQLFGFQVAFTHRLCTKGPWHWNAPFKRTALVEPEYNLLLLDNDAFDRTEIR